jgi:hypothetical protein
MKIRLTLGEIVQLFNELNGQVTKNIETYGLLSVSEKGEEFIINPTTFDIALDTKFERYTDDDDDGGNVEMAGGFAAAGIGGSIVMRSGFGASTSSGLFDLATANAGIAHGAGRSGVSQYHQPPGPPADRPHGLLCDGL